MSSKITKIKAVSNFTWRFAERIGEQSVSFIVSIILARLLLPEEFGMVAIVVAFTAMINVFVDSGLSSALIQKEKADDIDFSSVFYANIVLSLMLYIAIYFSAPFIAGFYKNQEMILIIRILSLTLIVSGIRNVQNAYVSRQMSFKKFFYANLSGTVISAVVGIPMAYFDYGVWALVSYKMVNVMVSAIILWFVVKWRPQKVFSIFRLRELLSYGGKIFASKLLDSAFNNLIQLCVGQFYSMSDLAFFNRGKSLPFLLINNINSSIDNILFPLLSKEQSSIKSVKAMTKRVLKISSYIIWPVMFGMCAIAEPLVIVLLTEKWVEIVPYLRIFCLAYALWPIHTANLSAIKALGKGGLYFWMTVVKIMIGTIIFFIMLQYGPLAIAMGVLLSGLIGSFINAYPSKKLLQYDYIEQIIDIFPIAVLSTVMFLVVYPINILGMNSMVTLVIQIITGVLVVVIGSVIFKMESFSYVFMLVKSYIKK